MNIIKINLCCLVLILFKMKLLNAEEVPNTISNQGNSPSSILSRFFNPRAMGFPNFGSGRFENPPSNYPTNSLFPFGNQNNNIQLAQQGSGFDSQNQNRNEGYYGYSPIQKGYPNQQDYQYQGDSMNPNPNYQWPTYPNNQNDGSMYSYQNPSQGNFQNRPIQEGFPNQDSYPYQGDSMNPYPNYQRPPVLSNPNDAIMYPGTMTRQYQNGGMPSNQGLYNRPGQDDPDQLLQYPSQDDQYPFQGNPNHQPDELNTFPVQFPDRPYQNQLNQYYPQTIVPHPSNQKFKPGAGQTANIQPYPFNNIPDPRIFFPTENPGVNQSNPSIQLPGNFTPSVTLPVTVNTEDFNNHPTSRPHGVGSVDKPNDENVVAILGKPVIKPSSPAQIVFDSSTTSPTQTKCVLDCQTTSEYDPICGSNNVTYFNSGKFYCAQNCGVAVILRNKGRCDGDEGNDIARR